MGELLEKALRGAFAGHPHVGDIRGRGLFWGIELVEERASKKPFDPARRVQGEHFLLAPPFIVERAQIGEIVEKLGRAFAATFG